MTRKPECSNHMRRCRSGRCPPHPAVCPHLLHGTSHGHGHFNISLFQEHVAFLHRRQVQMAWCLHWSSGMTRRRLVAVLIPLVTDSEHLSGCEACACCISMSKGSGRDSCASNNCDPGSERGIASVQILLLVPVMPVHALIFSQDLAYEERTSVVT